MSGLTVSVIVVSRGRPLELVRCLRAISQLNYRPFEVVVVADRAGVSAVASLDFSDRLKIVTFEEANISKARNLGLIEGAGEVAAFVDDDAVPEPGWLFHLMQPFADPSVAAAGGFVRGRNGISFQWRGQMIDKRGRSSHLALPRNAPVVLSAPASGAIKTQGTNCAFRRAVLTQIGGFDPAFRYYLEEADVNMRLAALGLRTAIVPLAEVHHGFAASAMRQANRMPKTLSEVGASQAVFLRKHCTETGSHDLAAEFCRDQKAALVRHMVAGNCQPRDVELLMKTLRDGLAEGAEREIARTPALAPPAAPYRAFRQSEDLLHHRIVAGYRIHAANLRREAGEAVSQGHIVSVFVFSRTSLYHRVRYRDGYWEQSGGLWGKSERTDPIFQIMSMTQRVRKEVTRVTPQRDPLNSADPV